MDEPAHVELCGRTTDPSRLEVRSDAETVWLTRQQMASLFGRDVTLHDHRGLPRISNDALAAITLMVAMSDPKEKELMVALLKRMLIEE